MTGLSPRNLKYMRAFAEAFPDEEIVQQLVAHLPWSHNVKLIEALKNPEEHLWYACQAVEHGWSRNVLVHQIESGLHRRGPSDPRETIIVKQSIYTEQFPTAGRVLHCRASAFLKGSKPTTHQGG